MTMFEVAGVLEMQIMGSLPTKVTSPENAGTEKEGTHTHSHVLQRCFFSEASAFSSGQQRQGASWPKRNTPWRWPNALWPCPGHALGLQ